MLIHYILISALLVFSIGLSFTKEILKAKVEQNLGSDKILPVNEKSKKEKAIPIKKVRVLELSSKILLLGVLVYGAFIIYSLYNKL